MDPTGDVVAAEDDAAAVFYASLRVYVVLLLYFVGLAATAFAVLQQVRWRVLVVPATAPAPPPPPAAPTVAPGSYGGGAASPTMDTPTKAALGAASPTSASALSPATEAALVDAVVDRTGQVTLRSTADKSRRMVLVTSAAAAANRSEDASGDVVLPKATYAHEVGGADEAPVRHAHALCGLTDAGRRAVKPGSPQVGSGVPFAFAVTSSAVMLSALLLVPLTVGATQVMVRYAQSMYLQWIDPALIEQLWNQVRPSPQYGRNAVAALTVPHHFQLRLVSDRRFGWPA